MIFREGLVGLLAVAQLAVPNQPAAYKYFFEMLREDGPRLERLGVIKKTPDGMQFYHGWLSRDGDQFLLYKEGTKEGGKLMITCQGAPSVERFADFTCYIDGGYFGSFDGRVDAQSYTPLSPFDKIANLIASTNINGVLASIKNDPIFKTVGPQANSEHQRIIKFIMDNPPDITK